jgi:outer membrane protein assembly factor BamE
MLALARCSAPVALVVFFGAALSGCSSVDLSGRELVESLKPYQVAVVQGNFVSREQVQALQPGMSRQQVRDILGTPLVASLFHADRWDYVFTLKRPGEDVQTRKLVVTFEGEHFVRAEGDEMPTEAEFVASLGVRTRSSKIPPLQATPEQLARYPAPSQPAASSAAATPAADSGAPRTSYPPLE